MKRLLLVVLIVVLAAAVTSPQGIAHAQPDTGKVEAAGLAVSPAIFEVTGSPGQTVTRSFLVRNISGQRLPVSAAVERLQPYEPEISPERRGQFDASKWVEIGQPHHILDIQEQREITVKVAIPENAEPGGHYATVALRQMVPQTRSDASRALVAPQVGVMMMITVPGDAVRELEARTSASRLHWSSRVPFDAVFANTGSIHVIPTGKITVRNLFGSTKAELELKPGIVLPNTVREFPAAWEGPLLFGLYSAEASATYGPDQARLSGGKRYFVVINWPLLLPLLIVAVPTVIFASKTYRRWPAALRAFRSAGRQ